MTCKNQSSNDMMRLEPSVSLRVVCSCTNMTYDVDICAIFHSISMANCNFKTKQNLIDLLKRFVKQYVNRNFISYAFNSRLQHIFSTNRIDQFLVYISWDHKSVVMGQDLSSFSMHLLNCSRANLIYVWFRMKCGYFNHNKIIQNSKTN